jgi:putative membrane-bound dehydrogenase-like protein
LLSPAPALKYVSHKVLAMTFTSSRLQRVCFRLVGAAALSAACFSVLAQSRDAGSTRAPATAGGRPLKVLFLGHEQEQPHNAARMFPLLAAPLARRGIQLTYVGTPAEAFVPAKLTHYDALMLYGNHTAMTREQEQVLLEFVEGGRGLVALHSASDEFTSSDKYIALLGAQLQRHGTGEFTAEIVQPTHPVMQGVTPFTTWDETYVHAKHNPVDRTVLMERVDQQGREPWTWVRTQGKGRVFYTAYGHDERTWGNPGFRNLVEHGVAWAVDETARRNWQQLKMPEVSYLDGFNVPNYENRDPAPRYQMPFAPDDAGKFIQAPAEFDVQLFASEPDVIKPLTMTFDERGRLWVIEAFDYPNRVLNGLPGDDRIKILEDTNGDGRADKFTVFAEHLNLPSSLTFANGGVIVAGAPHFLFLKDTNGDDKADVREILSTGWGIRDSHAGASNLQYGPDNFVWGVVGYSGYDGEMNGKRLQFTQGPYRFKPDGSEFEYLTTSTNNTWGLGFSETFDVFGSTANNDPSWYMAIPNRYFAEVRGLPGTGPGAGRAGGPGYQSAAGFYAVHPTAPYIRQVDVFGGYTAAAGHFLYTARAFPKEYWNRIAFITEPTAHLVGQGILEKDGAGFVARDGWNLMSSAEEWFAPVAAQVGPDGAVWVADWYNFIAQHNPTPVGFSVGRGAAYETSMRDRIRGRIYRVVYKGAAASKKRALSKTDPSGLLEALASDNMFWRLHAQRLIVERGQKDVVPQLIALVGKQSVDAVGTNGGALHALWTLHGLGELTADTGAVYSAAVNALRHPAAGVRKAAAMVLPRTARAAAAVLAERMLQDPDPHTRLAVILAVADMPTSGEIGQALYDESQKTQNYTDRWLSRALYIAATRHQKGFTTAYHADRNKLPYSALPTVLRLGDIKPDWRSPSPADLASEWKEMQVPGNWESRGLPDFDGVVWFTRTINGPQGSAANVVSLGAIRNISEVWINGMSIAPTPFSPATPAAAVPGPGAGVAGASGVGREGRGTAPGASPAPTSGRGNAPATYTLPADALRSGSNTITVRIQNPRNEGGFIGTPEAMYIQAGETRIPLAGTWKYRVERQTNAGSLYTKAGQLAAHVAFTAEGGLAGAAGAGLPPVAAPAPDVVLQLGVIPNQMKYDRTELTVASGQLVELVFTNPDVMQHNFVLGAAGSLTQIGQAADRLAASPTGLAQQYVPDSAQVIFATKLLEPGQTMTFQFRAPAAPGQYPYVCTFPSHWQVMNGILNVVAPGGRGGRGGRGGGF